MKRILLTAVLLMGASLFADEIDLKVSHLNFVAHHKSKVCQEVNNDLKLAFLSAYLDKTLRPVQLVDSPAGGQIIIHDYDAPDGKATSQVTATSLDACNSYFKIVEIIGIR